MSENSTNKNVRDDEIDLFDLFSRIGKRFNRWMNALGRAFLTSLIFLLRRWLPVSLSLVAGVGLSFLLKTSSTSFYTSDLILRNNTIPNGDMIAYLNRLHAYCEEKNFNALAEAVALTPEQVNNIIDISAFWIIDKGRDDISDYVDYKNKHNIYDTINVRMQDRLDIRVRINSPQEFPNIRRGLISYINSDSLFQQRNRFRIRQNHELLFRLNYDIVQLDSLQKVKYFEDTRIKQPLTGGQMVFLQEQKTQLVYTDIYSLYSRKQALEAERDLYNGIVTVLSEFSLPSKQENGAIYYGKFVIPILFGITVIILILIANRKKLKEIYNRY